MSRVRFSPTTALFEGPQGLELVQARRTRQRPSLADMEREFLT